MSNFALQVNRFVQKAKKRQDEAVRKIALELYQKIVIKTPVDTGRARANWAVGLNRMPASTTSKTQWRAVKKAAEDLMKRIVAGDIIYITNNLDYIIYLEQGTSQQAPAGMVAVTLREYPGIVQKSVREVKAENP